MMKQILIQLFAFLTFIYFPVSSSLFQKRELPIAPDWNLKQTPFPVVKREKTVLTFQSALNGTVHVPDPFSWLEGPLNSTSEIIKFQNDQNEFYNSYFEKCKDVDLIRQSIEDADTFDRISYPQPFGTLKNHVYLYSYSKGGDDTISIYLVTEEEIQKAYSTKFNPLPGKEILDANAVGKDNDVNFYSLSPDGKYLLYTVVPKNGFGAGTAYVRDISLPPSQIQNDNKETILDVELCWDTWLSDSSGFFYTQEAEQRFPITNSTIRFHRLGTDVSQDIEIVKKNPFENEYWQVELSDDKKYLIVYSFTNSGDQNRIFIASLDQPISNSMKWLAIFPTLDFASRSATNIGTEFYFYNKENAKSYNFVKIKPDFTKAKTVENLNELTERIPIFSIVIPESKDAKATDYVTFDNGKILISYVREGRNEFYLYDLQTGKQLQRILPDFLGNTGESSFSALWSGTDVFIWAWTLISPGQLYHIKWDDKTKSATTELIFQSKVKSIDADQFIVKQLFATSKDGTKVPFFIQYRKDAHLDGSMPAMINYYAAYGYTWLPFYFPDYTSFVNDYNGVFILAQPRGGGEVNGDEWHQDAIKEKKQNTVDDMKAIIEYLIENKIAARGKIILDVDAAPATTSMILINQAEEGLIGALIARRGIYDLLKLENSIDSERRIPEWGSPDDPKAFDWLIELSPIDNINVTKAYPTILICPFIDSDTSEPWQSHKTIATLQHDLDQNPNPLLLTESKTNIYGDFVREVRIEGFAIVAHALDLRRNK